MLLEIKPFKINNSTPKYVLYLGIHDNSLDNVSRIASDIHEEVVVFVVFCEIHAIAVPVFDQTQDDIAETIITKIAARQTGRRNRPCRKNDYVSAVSCSGCWRRTTTQFSMSIPSTLDDQAHLTFTRRLLSAGSSIGSTETRDIRIRSKKPISNLTTKLKKHFLPISDKK